MYSFLHQLTHKKKTDCYVIELRIHENYRLSTCCVCTSNCSECQNKNKSELVIQLTIWRHIVGLIDARMSTSDKVLPVYTI